MNPNSFSAETQQQALVFDKIGIQYEEIFGTNKNQLNAIEWLLQRLQPNSHILDIGSGTGVPTARTLVDAGHNVTGVDISAEMVRIAKHQVPKAIFLQADAANLTFPPGSFHAVTAFFSLLMLRRATIESLLKQLSTVMQTPGYLLLSMVEGDYDYKQLSFLDQSTYITAYPRDVLHRLLNNLSFTVLDSHIIQFQSKPEAKPETQMFFYCQYQPKNIE